VDQKKAVERSVELREMVLFRGVCIVVIAGNEQRGKKTQQWRGKMGWDGGREEREKKV
jgi:hypothetical protein